MVNLCGLWKAQTKAGKNYLRGNVGGAVIMVFPNEKKTAENQPDYRVVIAEKARKDNANANAAANVTAQPQVQQGFTGDDIPF